MFALQPNGCRCFIASKQTAKIRNRVVKWTVYGWWCQSHTAALHRNNLLMRCHWHIYQFYSEIKITSNSEDCLQFTFAKNFATPIASVKCNTKRVHPKQTRFRCILIEYLMCFHKRNKINAPNVLIANWNDEIGTEDVHRHTGNAIRSIALLCVCSSACPSIN